MSSGLNVRFDDPVAFRTEYERNIVQGGVFIPTPGRFELRAVVMVELELAWCGEKVRLEAEIVHCTPEGTEPKRAGVAVQFLGPIDDLRQRLGPIATAAATAAVHEAPAAPAAPARLPEAPETSDVLDLEISDPDLHLYLDPSEPDASEPDVIEPDAIEPDAFDPDAFDPDAVTEGGGSEPRASRIAEPDALVIEPSAEMAEVPIALVGALADGPEGEDLQAELEATARGDGFAGAPEAASEGAGLSLDLDGILSDGTLRDEAPSGEGLVFELEETAVGSEPVIDLEETARGGSPGLAGAAPAPDPLPVAPEASAAGTGPILDLELESDPLAPVASGVVEGSTAFDPLDGVVERRSAERLSARLNVHLDAAHISLDGRTRDISEKGVLLSADGNDLPIGKKVTLALTHPQTGERLTIDGTVARHVESHGTVGAVGIAFDRSLDGDEHLRSFIREVQAAEKERRDAGISGVIEELGMANLLQMFGQSSPCGTLTVCSGAEEGVIAFERGDLRYVRLGNLRGVKALARLLGWQQGAFEFVSQVDSLADEESPLSLEGALLEAVRQLDEAARDEGGEIDLGAVLRLDRNALTTLDKPLAQIEEAVLDLAAAGLSVRRLLDVIPEPDGDILGALRALLDRGLVTLDS